MQQSKQKWLDEIEKNENLSLDDIERSLRYARDLTRGLAEIKTYPQGVTVFGSARLTENDVHYQKAYELGQKLAQSQCPVITGGGRGIMEAANRGAFEAGGRSIGLNITLPHEQQLNNYTTDSLQFEYFFARKVMLTFSSKAYVYFPGGFGTMDELTEILTLIQTGKIPTSPIFLYSREFWQPLDDFFRVQMEEKEKTIAVGDRALYQITDDVDAIVSAVDQLTARDTQQVVAESLSTAL
jgi:uncharacterized protein (TIGR00730 family)